MDMFKSARNLQKLLIFHDKLAHQIDQLDMHINETSRRLLVHDLGYHSNDTSSQCIRLSVGQGVRHTMEMLRQRTVARVQKLSQEVLAYLSEDGQSNPQQTTFEINQNTVTIDTAAIRFNRSVEMTLRQV